MHTVDLSLQSPLRTFVESAQNLIPEMSWGLARNYRPSMWWPRSVMLNLACESEYSALPSLLSETLLHVQPHPSLFHFVVLRLEGWGRGGGVRSLIGYHPEEIPHCWRVTSVMFDDAWWRFHMHTGHHLPCPLLTTALLSCRTRLRESVPSKEQLTTTSLRQSFYVNFGSEDFDRSSLKTASCNGHRSRSIETKVTMRAEHEASYRLLAFGRSQSELALKDKPTKMTKKATTKKHNKKQVTDGISACEQIWHDPHSKMLTTMSLPSVFLCFFFLFFSFSLSLSRQFFVPAKICN